MSGPGDAPAAAPDIAELFELGARVGELLVDRGETVSVAEGAAGGLVSAALLARPGASAYYVGGSVIYTPTATKALLSRAIPTPSGMRGATEQFASYLAESVARRLGTTWGIGEGGAAGPAGNPYGDPAGHAWTAVWGPGTGEVNASVSTRHILTGSSDRASNMLAFARAALSLLGELVGTG